MFPMKLILDKYVIHEVEMHDEEFIKQYEEMETDHIWENKYIYELYGVVSHSGSMSSGHYVAYTSYEYNRHWQWYFFSDKLYWKATE